MHEDIWWLSSFKYSEFQYILATQYQTKLEAEVTRTQSPFKSNTQTHEKIAEYYLRKASTESEESAPKEVIEPANGMSRLLQQGNFSTSLSKPFVNTPLIRAKSLPASSGTSNESFAFLGTPTLPAIIPEPLKEFPHLTDYNGSRPSFGVGTTTSTPYTKKFTVTAQIQKREEHRPNNSAHLTPERKLSEHDTTTGLTNSLEDCYAVDIRLAEKYDEAKKRIEKSKEQKALRILTKRTVVEKVTVESKKTASTQEIYAVSGFLCKLLTGQPVAGYGNKVIQLTDSDLVWYGMIVTIESYTGVVERDPSLAVIISRILVMISCTVPNFESVLLGKLLSASHLLTLNEEK
ncbi:unnamed protein product [Angiostrongylus costaricensis]|uniref:Nucleoporin GLE1 n=1 Tax=Angiostrongylus costaricensis TaxID=334426 RepID=A0A0R3PNM2_ANGCS|nr:unnamed protein product [Angiostrongylus costaricensis]